MPEDARSQLDKFKDLARELECDEDEAMFDERLKKLSKPNSGRPGVELIPDSNARLKGPSRRK